MFLPMKQINILTNNSAPNSRAFNTPLMIADKLFAEKGYRLDFYFAISANLYKCDILFINSNFFRTFWKRAKSVIFTTLEKASTEKVKIIWFDTTDSTWCTQFEVMPYVDKFLKSHLLKERDLYLKNFRTGRLFTDSFDKLYNAGEKEENYPPLKKEDIEKLAVSWTPCFEQYDEKRFSVSKKISNLIRPFSYHFFTPRINLRFEEVDKKRKYKISARFGLTHSRPSVVAHRKAIASLLAKRGCQTSRISLEEYFSEMRDSQISISPFGVGEFCYRDYESIICGSTMLKPDMGHMETWPDIYQPGKTFITHKWDLSDFDEKIDFLLSNYEKRCEIALEAQNIYKQAVSDDGMSDFVSRLLPIIS